MLIGLLRTIFFIAVFYYIFKIIGKYVLPFFLKKYINKIKDRQNETFSGEKRPEGEIIIENNSKIKKKDVNDNKNSNDEYVDFEDIKD